MTTDPIVDDTGREIAPPQAISRDRPQGPWTLNAAPRAVFAFHQPAFDNGPGFPMFQIIGGPSDKSTVSAFTLMALGIPVPEAAS